MRWKDAKDVYMLSTEETADMVECDTQCGREKKMKPAMVPLYKMNMGGGGPERLPGVKVQPMPCHPKDVEEACDVLSEHSSH